MNPATRGNERNANAPVLYIALELSNKTWKLVLGDADRRRYVAVHAADLIKLGEALAHAKERFGVTLSAHRGLPNSHQEPAANAGVALATGGLIFLSLFPGVD